MFGFDPLYFLLAIPGLLLGLWAQRRVTTTFEHYSQVTTSRGYSGAEIAQAILRAEGISGVRIEPTEGFLSDHYDPSDRTLRLSPQVYSGRSVAAAGVAAHEVGHAIQHARAYAPLTMRSGLVPLLSITSRMAGPAIGVGFMLAAFTHSPLASTVVLVGIGLFAFSVLFQLVTLPVEIDASRRALAAIEGGRLLSPQEHEGAQEVLTAAAMTYIAAAVASLLQLLYFVLRYASLRDRER